MRRTARRRHQPGGSPGAVDDAAAAALGCRFATSYRALTTRADLRPEEWVTVIGVGGVGLSAVQSQPPPESG